MMDLFVFDIDMIETPVEPKTTAELVLETPEPEEKETPPLDLGFYDDAPVFAAAEALEHEAAKADAVHRLDAILDQIDDVVRELAHAIGDLSQNTSAYGAFVPDAAFATSLMMSVVADDLAAQNKQRELDEQTYTTHGDSFHFVGLGKSDDLNILHRERTDMARPAIGTLLDVNDMYFDMLNQGVQVDDRTRDAFAALRAITDDLHTTWRETEALL